MDLISLMNQSERIMKNEAYEEEMRREELMVYIKIQTLRCGIVGAILSKLASQWKKYKYFSRKDEE